MDLIKNCLLPFDKVTLPDLDKVQLMNRTDKKFCLHISQLPIVLEAIRNDYSLLEIQGRTLFNYDNTYFDTPDNQMFLAHHNGRSNRIKIRIRRYVESDLNFLEIKLKNNKGRTLKERVVKQNFVPAFTFEEKNFLEQGSPYTWLELQPKIRSFFNRFTLVNHQFTHRVTIDVFPGFSNSEKEITLDKLVIIEIKQDKASEQAMIVKALQEQKIKCLGFSKYCIGRALLDENLKKNNFKPLLLKIRKYYYN
jgi:hypothetical protein